MGQRVDAPVLFGGQEAEGVKKAETGLGVEWVKDGVEEGGAAVIEADVRFGIGQITAPVSRGQKFFSGLRKLFIDRDIHVRAKGLERNGAGESGRAAAENGCLHNRPPLYKDWQKYTAFLAKRQFTDR